MVVPRPDLGTIAHDFLTFERVPLRPTARHTVAALVAQALAQTGVEPTEGALADVLERVLSRHPKYMMSPVEISIENARAARKRDAARKYQPTTDEK